MGKPDKKGDKMKSWYTSKTIWANFIGIIGVFTAKKFGYEITPEVTVSILAGINTLLRFITKEEVTW